MKNRMHMIVLAALCTVSANGQVEYFGKVPGAPIQSSRPAACTPDGEIVVGTAFWTDGWPKPVRWTVQGGIEFLEMPPSTKVGSAYGVNDDGSVVVGKVNGYGAARWDNGAVTLLESLPGGPVSSEFALGILPDGSVAVGGSWSANGDEATVWPKGAAPYGLLNAHPTTKAFGAQQIASPDVIVGYATVTGGVTQAFLYKNGVMNALGSLPGGKNDSTGVNISADGSVVVGDASSSISGQYWEAYFWTDRTGMVGLGHFPTAPAAKTSVANAVTDDGWRIVGQSSHTSALNCFGSNDTPHAFVWDPIAGMQSLHDILEEEQGLVIVDYTLYLAVDCSSDGTYIVGEAINIPECRLEGYRAKIKPFCYADCDQSPGHKRVLDAFDLLCFINRFDQQDFYTDCDQNGEHDFFDLLCYINEFSKGCP